MVSSPAPTRKKKGCFAFVVAMSPFKSSRRSKAGASASGVSGSAWTGDTGLSPENLEQRFLLSSNEDENSGKEKENRPRGSLGVKDGNGSTLLPMDHLERKGSGGRTATATLGFAGAETKQRAAFAAGGLTVEIREIEAHRGAEAKPGYGDEVKDGGEKEGVVRPVFGGGHSSVAGPGGVPGLQVSTPESSSSNLHSRGRARNVAGGAKGQLSFVPPPVPASSSKDEEGLESGAACMCPFCRHVQLAEDGDDETCKQCGLSMQVDDSAFMQIALEKVDGDEKGKQESEKAPTWALPDESPVNLHKIFLPNSFMEDMPIPPEPQRPAHRPYQKSGRGGRVALENGTPVRGGADLKVSCSMLGWMSMPVNVGVPGEEKYQHRKVSRKMFITTSKVIYADATHPHAPIWVDDDIDDGKRKVKTRTNADEGGDGALGGVLQGIAQGLGSLLGDGNHARGRYRAVTTSSTVGESHKHSGWDKESYQIDL